jgi:hypothetical protein
MAQSSIQLMLKHKEITVARLNACKYLDSWLICDFSPTEAFLEFALLFDEFNLHDEVEIEEEPERFGEIIELLNRELSLINEEKQVYLTDWVLRIHPPKIYVEWKDEIAYP